MSVVSSSVLPAYQRDFSTILKELKDCELNLSRLLSERGGPEGEREMAMKATLNTIAKFRVSARLSNLCDLAVQLTTAQNFCEDLQDGQELLEIYNHDVEFTKKHIERLKVEISWMDSDVVNTEEKPDPASELKRLQTSLKADFKYVLDTLYEDEKDHIRRILTVLEEAELKAKNESECLVKLDDENLEKTVLMLCQKKIIKRYPGNKYRFVDIG